MVAVNYSTLQKDNGSLSSYKLDACFSLYLYMKYLISVLVFGCTLSFSKFQFASSVPVSNDIASRVLFVARLKR
jgi:hypothetical protein